MIPGVLDKRRAEVSAYGIVFRLTVLVMGEQQIDVVGRTVVVLDDGVDDESYLLRLLFLIGLSGLHVEGDIEVPPTLPSALHGDGVGRERGGLLLAHRLRHQHGSGREHLTGGGIVIHQRPIHRVGRRSPVKFHRRGDSNGVTAVNNQIVNDPLVRHVHHAEVGTKIGIAAVARLVGVVLAR